MLPCKLDTEEQRQILNRWDDNCAKLPKSQSKPFNKEEWSQSLWQSLLVRRHQVQMLQESRGESLWRKWHLVSVKLQEPAKEHSCSGSYQADCVMGCLLITLTIANRNNTAVVTMDTQSETGTALVFIGCTETCLERWDTVHGFRYFSGVYEYASVVSLAYIDTSQTHRLFHISITETSGRPQCYCCHSSLTTVEKIIMLGRKLDKFNPIKWWSTVNGKYVTTVIWWLLEITDCLFAQSQEKKNEENCSLGVWKKMPLPTTFCGV